MDYVPTTLRAPVDDDRNFILSTWLKSFRNSHFACMIPNDIYFKAHKALIMATLQESGVVVAVNPEDESQIFGYGVYTPNGGATLCHYIYVKESYRRLGIGTTLFRAMLADSDHSPDVPAIATHSTRALKDYGLREKWEIVYNPYMLGAS